MNEDLNNPNKNRLVSVGKAIIKSGLKDLAVTAVPAYTLALGTTFVTGNPMLGISVGSLAETAGSFGIAGTRVYNTVTNK